MTLRTTDALKAIATIVTSILIAAILVELSVRFFDLVGQPSHRRFLFMTREALANAAPGVPGYAPNAQVRQAGVFAEPGLTRPASRFRVVFDVRYSTNNRGHVQRADSACGVPTVAVIGDSFTEGQGAIPWFYELEGHGLPISGAQLVNLAFLGTGFQSWAVALAHHRACYDFKKLVIVFIGDDWLRPVWEIHQGQLGCINGNGDCREGRDLFFPFPADPRPQALIDAARARALEGDRLANGRRRWWDDLRIVDVIGRAFEIVRRNRDDTMRRGQDALTSILAEFGQQNVRLVHVPMQDEVLSGASRRETRKAQLWLDDRGIRYSFCALEGADFPAEDGHPNVAGYAKVRACVQAAIDDLVERPSPPADSGLRH